MISSDLSSLDVRTYQPPVGLLAIAALCVAVGVLGVTLSPGIAWASAGYGVCCIGATSLVGLFRLLDGRLRARAGYRLVPWATAACQVVLAVSWLVAIADAWRLATGLSH